jgi:hypothetical protein
MYPIARAVNPSLLLLPLSKVLVSSDTRAGRGGVGASITGDGGVAAVGGIIAASASASSIAACSSATCPGAIAPSAAGSVACSRACSGLRSESPVGSVENCMQSLRRLLSLTEIYRQSDLARRTYTFVDKKPTTT